MSNHPARRWSRPPRRRLGVWQPVPGMPGVFAAPAGKPPPVPTPVYQHAEAFCLMTYEADDGSESEVIWNSRDGVTPFVITLRSGKEAHHVFRHAIRLVDYVPPPGSRIFVDLTPARALELAARNVGIWWPADVASCRTGGRYETPEAMTRALADAYLQPGAPDLIEVTADLVTAGDRYPGRDA